MKKLLSMFLMAILLMSPSIMSVASAVSQPGGEKQGGAYGMSAEETEGLLDDQRQGGDPSDDRPRDPWKEMEPRDKAPGKIDEKDDPLDGDNSSDGPYCIMVNGVQSFRVDLSGYLQITDDITLMALLENSSKSITGSNYKGFIYQSAFLDYGSLTGKYVRSSAGAGSSISQCNDVSISLQPYNQSAHDEMGLTGRAPSSYDYYATFTVPMNHAWTVSATGSYEDMTGDLHNITLGDSTSGTVNMTFLLLISSSSNKAQLLLDIPLAAQDHIQLEPFEGQFLPRSKADIDDFKQTVIDRRNEQLDRMKEEVGDVLEGEREKNMRENQDVYGMSDEQVQSLEELMAFERVLLEAQRRRERDEGTYTDDGIGVSDDEINTPPIGLGDDKNNAESLDFGGMNEIYGEMSAMSFDLPADLKDSISAPADAQGVHVMDTAGVVTLTYSTGMSIEELEAFYESVLSNLTLSPYSPQVSALYTGSFAGYKNTIINFQSNGSQTVVSASFMK